MEKGGVFRVYLNVYHVYVVHKETNETSLVFAILRGRVKRVIQKGGNSSSLWVKWLRSRDIGCTVTVIKHCLLSYFPNFPFVCVTLSFQTTALMMYTR